MYIMYLYIYIYISEKIKKDEKVPGIWGMAAMILGGVADYEWKLKGKEGKVQSLLKSC